MSWTAVIQERDRDPKAYNARFRKQCPDCQEDVLLMCNYCVCCGYGLVEGEDKLR